MPTSWRSRAHNPQPSASPAHAPTVLRRPCPWHHPRVDMAARARTCPKVTLDALPGARRIPTDKPA
eukprot:5290486-Alexandrium_andersonii.AAC.1